MLTNPGQFGEWARGGMADVFISYKKEDKARVAPLVAAFEARGYSVWWDQEIEAGEEWFRRILAEVRAAKLTIGVWSSRSVDDEKLFRPNREGKRYVEIEHDETPAGRLIPVLLEAGRIPLTYKHVQAVDLTGWRGGKDDSALASLWRRVEQLAGPGLAPQRTLAPPPVVHEPVKPDDPPRQKPTALERAEAKAEAAMKNRLPPAAGLAALAAAIAALLVWSPWNRSGPQVTEAPPVAAEVPAKATDASGAALLDAQPSPPAGFPDARTTPASTRAPVLTGGQTPGAFQAFRDCADCPEMVALPGGTFRMGDDASDQSNEKPARDVRLSGFAAGRFEVTRGEYAAFVSATGRADPQVIGITSCTWRSLRFTQSDRDPATCLNVSDAEAYAAWLSQRTGKTYRLLSEAQWEYAARGGTSSRRSFGDDERELGAHAWLISNSNDRTQPVGGKRANPYGLYDVHGNVWEWTRDCYQDTYRGLGSNDPVNESGACSLRVLRGGSWINIPQDLRSANRFRDNPSSRDNFWGFRLARDL